MKGFMDSIQGWITKHIVPVVNKITATYWFSIIADSILYIVPFSMVSAIPSLWNVIRTFVPALPDISPISTYSFGLIGLFVVFVIPYNVLVKEDRKDRAMIAGFTGIGTFMLCMNAQTTDVGTVFDIGKFGAGGMFTSMVVGWFVGLIYKKTARRSFFSEDSVIPDFVKNWFDNILAILFALLVAWIVTYVVKADVFTMVSIIMSPVTGFAQTLPGTIFMSSIKDVFYFFGISGWVFTPVTRTITQAAMAENMAAAAAGKVIPNIQAYGFSRYTMIGGEGSTLPLAIYMLFAKSKKNRMLGKATLVPSLFNINEPLVFSSIVNNPFMFIPMLLQSIILPANAWMWMHLGWASLHTQMFDMNNAPNAVSAFFMSAGDWRNALLVCVNLLLAAIIWYPFFKASDNYQVEQEEKKAAEKTAKKAAKKAAKQAAEQETAGLEPTA